MRHAPLLFKLLREEGLPVTTIMRVLVRFYGLSVEDAKRAAFGQDKQHEESWHVQPPRFGSLEGLEEFRKSLNNTHYVDIRIRTNGKYYWTDGDWIKCLDNPKYKKQQDAVKDDSNVRVTKPKEK